MEPCLGTRSLVGSVEWRELWAHHVHQLHRGACGGVIGLRPGGGGRAEQGARSAQGRQARMPEPPNQTKEEEIGNLPDIEFRIMIVKLIQNLEIKMESQINSLETRIEKMQEKFNKDLKK